MEIVLTQKFLKQLQKQHSLAAVISKQVELFRNNPFHPSLHTEKMEPKKEEIYSFRINKQWRVLFKKKKQDKKGTQELKVFLLAISKHYE